MKTIFAEQLTTAQMQGYLQSAVAPRPIALASTISQAGDVNLSPFSFFNVFSANPPVLIFSPVRRVRDGATKHTLDNLKEVPQVSIQIVNYAMVEQMSLASSEFPKGENEFTKAGFTEIPSDRIRPPRVKEAPVSFECEVMEIISLGEQAGAGQLVLAKVIALHIQEDYLHENGTLDTTKLDLVARMGENWYTRITKDTLFEIPKPLQNLGIGVDSLPLHVRESTVLTGNQLGRLGNTKHLPTKGEIEEFIRKNTSYFSGEMPMEAIHTLAAEWINEGRLEEAKLLLWAVKV